MSEKILERNPQPVPALEQSNLPHASGTHYRFAPKPLDKQESVIIFMARRQESEVRDMARDLTIWRPFRELTPFRDFDRMMREMDRLWGSFFGRELSPIDGGTWLPSLDVAETENEFVVKAEVPGMDPKDIEISLSDGLLTIKGEKKQEKEENEENYHLIERSYGTFTRSIRLPKEIQSDKIDASYKNGVLKVVLPKSEEAKKKEIKIRVE